MYSKVGFTGSCVFTFLGTCMSGHNLGFQRGLWLQCAYGIDLAKKYKSLISNQVWNITK